MQKLTEMKFFTLLETTSHIKTKLPILKDAYEEFIEYLMVTSNDNSQINIFYNQLRHAKIELSYIRQEGNTVVKKISF